MVDLDRVQQRLELLREYLGELDRLSRLSVSDYLRDHAYTGRYLVQVAAQSCIDLASTWPRRRNGAHRRTSATRSPCWPSTR